ncbi:MAG: signal recognition particle protein [Alphaproteobacteria bacterium]|nr:signal recognition particle protein [Alphaproteobacteria bacterium]MBR1756345.1 signal recognition particle protein [Alphaproteobacteria bacterium]
MFESLTNRLSQAFAKITSRGVLSEKDIDDAMREIRVALLEADVSLSVVKDFIANVKTEALGEKVVKSVQPGQMVIKIVHDELVKLLGAENTELNFNAPAPVVFLLVGLQGSGKTTTAAKIAKKLKKNKRILLASLDIYRPAAQEQLAQLGKQIEVDVLPIIAGQKPLDITKRAIETAKNGVYDLLILDSAGRLQIDENLMNEAAEVKKMANPTETLLVADALIGQEACNVAKEFNDKVGVSGLVLTRMDGTSRAGAALSMKMVAGAPIKFLGTGEKLDDIEEFHADRVAGRILGQGDVVSLVEKAMENVNQAEAEQMANKMFKGSFDLNDMLSQMQQMKKLGSVGSIIGMLPGLSKFQAQIEESGVGDKLMKSQEAIILSMTKEERAHPDIIKASRKRRIAAGAGVEVHDVNVLLKSYEQMSTMMKKMGKFGGLSSIAKLLKGNPFGKMPGGMKNNFPF